MSAPTGTAEISPATAALAGTSSIPPDSLHRAVADPEMGGESSRRPVVMPVGGRFRVVLTIRSMAVWS